MFTFILWKIEKIILNCTLKVRNGQCGSYYLSTKNEDNVSKIDGLSIKSRCQVIRRGLIFYMFEKL